MPLKVDVMFHRVAEGLAQRTSRRSFLFRLTATLGLFGSAGVLLPINRVPAASPQSCKDCCKAKGIHANDKCKTLTTDATKDQYWLFADMEGKPCARGCCGASAAFGGCPRTVKDYDNKELPVAFGGCWLSNILDCDGNVHCVAYADCCINKSLSDAANPLHLGKVVPCEEAANCRRLPHGTGRSWCNTGRIEPTPSGQFSCTGMPTEGPERRGWALCTYAKDLHPGPCTTGGMPRDIEQRQCT